MCVYGSLQKPTDHSAHAPPFKISYSFERIHWRIPKIYQIASKMKPN